MKVVGEKAVNPFLADLDKLKLDKVRLEVRTAVGWLVMTSCSLWDRLKSVQRRSSFLEGRRRPQLEEVTGRWRPKLLLRRLKLRPNPLFHPRSPRVLPAR